MCCVLSYSIASQKSEIRKSLMVTNGEKKFEMIQKRAIQAAGWLFAVALQQWLVGRGGAGG